MRYNVYSTYEMKGNYFMKAIWNDQVVAEAPKEDLIYIEGNWYFPPTSVNKELLHESPTPYTCPWKGDCQYFDIGTGPEASHDDAWTYPDPKKSAIDQVKKDFSNYVAFWRSAKVVD
ncbi:MAG: DUF427 domain-containing protein [Candidatus Saccharimonadales bacterium]